MIIFVIGNLNSVCKSHVHCYSAINANYMARQKRFLIEPDTRTNLPLVR